MAIIKSVQCNIYLDCVAYDHFSLSLKNKMCLKKIIEKSLFDLNSVPNQLLEMRVTQLLSFVVNTNMIWFSLFVAHSLSRSFNCCKHSSNISLKRLSKMHSNASAWSFRGQACIDLLCKFDALVYWIQFCAHILLKNLLFIILISFAQCNVFFCSFFWVFVYICNVCFFCAVSIVVAVVVVVVVVVCCSFFYTIIILQ